MLRSKARSDDSDSVASAGNVFLKNSAQMPECLRFVSEPYGSWKKLVDVGGHTLELMARRAGWYFSYLASIVEAGTLRSSLESATRSAVEKVMENVDRCGFNALEIVGITTHRVLGLRYVRVVAVPRQLQPSPRLRDPYPYYYYPKGFEDFETIFWTAAEMSLGSRESRG
jgi:hypothetical protein